MFSISRVPVKDLISRYEIGKTALYSRFQVAKVNPVKDGNKSYISQEELEELDRLDSHLKTGGSFESFVPNDRVPTRSAIQKREESLEIPPVEILLALIEKLALHQLPKPKGIAQFEDLEKAVTHQWVLPTSAVQEIAGVKPTGDRYCRGSFVFVRSGKIGRESGWRVEKNG